MDTVFEFYELLAADYHSMYPDWKSEVLRQGKLLDSLIRKYASETVSILDCTCGIGTQAIGLAAQGYQVNATDLAPAAVERARREADGFGVSVAFDTADLRKLDEKISDRFDVLISFDNSMSHFLEDADLLQATKQMWGRLREKGTLLISIRDYDQVIQERRIKDASPPLPGTYSAFISSNTQPTMPRVFDDPKGRRIVFQIWDWAEDGRSYTLRHFHLHEAPDAWQTRCYDTVYRALLRSELSEILHQAGFQGIQWLMPAESGYYQPIVIARKNTHENT